MPQPSRIINSAFLLIFYIYLELSNFIYQPTKTMPNFQKRNSLPRHLCFPRVSPAKLRDKDSERWTQRQTEISFPTWLCRTVSYLYLIIPRGILYSIYFNNLFNFCPKNKNPRRLLYTPRGFFLSCIYRFTILYVLFWIRHKYTPRLRADMSKVIAPP